MNFRGELNKSVYEAGELMTISVTGGDQPGWVRVGIRDERGEEVSRATGPTGMGDDGDPTWTASMLPGPISLTARAPYMPGTYQWEVGWFGNTFPPQPPVLVEHNVNLQWHYVPLPVFTVYSDDREGPSLSALTVSPDPSHGAREVTISAIASDAGAGNLPIRRARLAVAGDGPFLWVAMSASDGLFDSVDEPIETVLDVSMRSPGTLNILIEAADALGNWSRREWTTITVSPPPRGDAVPPVAACQTPVPAVVPPGEPVLAGALVDDRGRGWSPIGAGEAFISAAAAPGTGFPLRAADGALDSPVEMLEGLIPTDGLPDGQYVALVHAADVSDSWSAYCETTFQVRLATDATGPSVASAAFLPAATAGAEVAVLRATATDVGSGYGTISEVEYSVGPLLPPGAGTTMTAADGLLDSAEELVTGAIAVAGWEPGAYPVWIRARDDRGNWGPETPASLQVTAAGADQEGPSIPWIFAELDHANGGIIITGDADDTVTGDSRPVLVEFFVNHAGLPGFGRPVQLQAPGANRSVSRFRTKLDVGTTATRSSVMIYARAMDIRGNWGALTGTAFRFE